jgi:hypothetical protein
MHFIMRYALNYISLQWICYRVRVTRRVKKTRAGAGMCKNLYPRAGMSFLSGRVRVNGCGYERHYPTGFYPLSSLRMDFTDTI